MKRILFFVTILLIVISCNSTYTAMPKSQKRVIKLQQGDTVNLFLIYNKNAKMYFNPLDIQRLALKKGAKEEDVMTLFQNGGKIEFVDDNMGIKTDLQNILFSVIWELLNQGKAIVYSNDIDGFVPEILFVRVENLNGIQERIIFKNSDLILTKVISFGE